MSGDAIAASPSALRGGAAPKAQGGLQRISDRTFLTLDGIRGVAAFCVLVWHMPQINPLPSAYLAVDVFFMMSGFVLAYRYEQRLQDRSAARAFIIMRLVRLWPLYALGTLIGAAAALAQLGLHSPLGHYPRWVGELILGLLFVPILAGPAAIVFPLNVPGWSLFYEVAINAALPWISRRLRGLTMGLALAASAAALFAIARFKGDLQVTGQMPYFALAPARVVFGFCTGILLFRLWMGNIGFRWPAAVVIAAVVACFLIPRTGVSGSVLTPFVVVFVMPALVWAAVSTEPSAEAARILRWAGDLSFPLYATHYPVLILVHWLGERLHVAHTLADGASLIAAIGVAWLAMAGFDGPVRRGLGAYVRRKMEGRQQGRPRQPSAA